MIIQSIILLINVLGKRYRFFYFHGKKDFVGRKLNSEYVINNIQKIFKENIRKNIKFIEDSPLDEDTLVIHVRSGDIFVDVKKDYYQNPINFYTEITEGYGDYPRWATLIGGWGVILFWVALGYYLWKRPSKPDVL